MRPWRETILSASWAATSVARALASLTAMLSPRRQRLAAMRGARPIRLSNEAALCSLRITAVGSLDAQEGRETRPRQAFPSVPASATISVKGEMIGGEGDGIWFVPRVSEIRKHERSRSLRAILRACRRRRAVGARRHVACGAAFRARSFGPGIAVDPCRRHCPTHTPDENRHRGSGVAALPSPAISRGSGHRRPDQRWTTYLRRRTQRVSPHLRGLRRAL